MPSATLKFIRTQAEQMGGVRTPRGQAMHRAAAHVQRLEELVDRLVRGPGSESLEQTARVLHGLARDRVVAQGGPSPPLWGQMSPDERVFWLTMARAARGS